MAFGEWLCGVWSWRQELRMGSLSSSTRSLATKQERSRKCAINIIAAVEGDTVGFVCACLESEEGRYAEESGRDTAGVVCLARLDSSFLLGLLTCVLQTSLPCSFLDWSSCCLLSALPLAGHSSTYCRHSERRCHGLALSNESDLLFTSTLLMTMCGVALIRIPYLWVRHR